MVCASYCAPYSKWLCMKYEANMWCPCCMTSFCSRTFYFLFLSPMMSGAVHTGVEVRRIDLEMSGLVERP